MVAGGDEDDELRWDSEVVDQQATTLIAGNPQLNNGMSSNRE